MLKRTTSDDLEFQSLVKLLDKYLAIVDGDQHSFYDQYNGIESLKQVVIYYEGGLAVGCGAFKEYDNETVEIKRMFVRLDFRGKRIGGEILTELEKWAAELNYTQSILETGKKQVEAIKLYLKCGYTIIPNYGQYEGVENSVCMRKGIG